MKYVIVFADGSNIKDDDAAKSFASEYGCDFINFYEDESINKFAMIVRCEDNDIVDLIKTDERVYDVEEESTDVIPVPNAANMTLPDPSEYVKKYVKENEGDKFGDQIKLINNWLKENHADHDDFVWDGKTLEVTFKDGSKKTFKPEDIPGLTKNVSESQEIRDFVGLTKINESDESDELYDYIINGGNKGVDSRLAKMVGKSPNRLKLGDLVEYAAKQYIKESEIFSYNDMLIALEELIRYVESKYDSKINESVESDELYQYITNGGNKEMGARLAKMIGKSPVKRNLDALVKDAAKSYVKEYASEGDEIFSDDDLKDTVMELIIYIEDTI